jgi:hypothetical protein
MVKNLSCLPRTWLGTEHLPDDPACSCGLTGVPWELHRRGCDRSTRPYVDDDTLALVEGAVASLVVLRGSGSGDADAVLSCLASLIAEAHSRLPDAVADAREHGCSWDEVAGRLATTPSTARGRYAGYTRWRACLPVEEG